MTKSILRLVQISYYFWNKIPVFRAIKANQVKKRPSLHSTDYTLKFVLILLLKKSIQNELNHCSKVAPTCSEWTSRNNDSD